MATLILHHDDKQNNIASKIYGRRELHECMEFKTLDYYGCDVLKELLSSRNLFCLTLPKKVILPPLQHFSKREESFGI